MQESKIGIEAFKTYRMMHYKARGHNVAADTGNSGDGDLGGRPSTVVTKNKTTGNGKVYRMSNKDVRSDARPFTTPHQSEEMNRDEKEEEEEEDKGKERKKKDNEPSRTPRNPPILASQLQPKAVSAEERLLKTLAGEEEGEEEGSSDEEGGSSSDDIRERTERALRLCGQQQHEGEEPAATGHHSRPHLTLVQKKTVFGTINGDVYIGGGGDGRAQQSTTVGSEGKKPWVSLSEEEKAHIKRCAQSRRMVEEGDLLQIASKIGKDWKSVGNGLKLNHSCLDLIESECSSLVERIEMMLYRWMQWKCERATVARLTKALYNHNEYAAVLVMQP